MGGSSDLPPPKHLSHTPESIPDYGHLIHSAETPPLLLIIFLSVSYFWGLAGCRLFACYVTFFGSHNTSFIGNLPWISCVFAAEDQECRSLTTFILATTRSRTPPADLAFVPRYRSISQKKRTARSASKGTTHLQQSPGHHAESSAWRIIASTLRTRGRMGSGLILICHTLSSTLRFFVFSSCPSLRFSYLV